MKYVNAMWSEYHNLQEGTSTRTHETEESANSACESCNDKILKFQTADQAEEYVRNFKALCAAAWTPNQSDADKEENGIIISHANRNLEILDCDAVSMAPWEEEALKYKIKWKAILTGKTGEGSKAFPKAQAESICDGLNKQDRGLLVHWIEEA